MSIKQKIVEKYIIDHKRYRFSFPFFNRRIYIPEQVMKNLGINLNVEDLPKHLKFPGKLISEDYRRYPCQGWVYNVEKYNKKEKEEIKELDNRLVPYNYQVFLGYDEKVLSDGSALKTKLKAYEESMTFYVARIPNFVRYAKDQMYYQGIFTDTVTKEVVIEKIITIDYRKHAGITFVV